MTNIVLSGDITSCIEKEEKEVMIPFVLLKNVTGEEFSFGGKTRIISLWESSLKGIKSPLSQYPPIFSQKDSRQARMTIVRHYV